MNFINYRTFLSALSLTGLLTTSLFFSSCDDDNEPQKENTPELITELTLTFSATGKTPVVVTATDQDGEGVQELQVDGAINLDANTNYTMSVTLINGLADPEDPEYNITEEVEEEGAEHLFFYSWTNGLFIDPQGNGNIDNREDDMNYLDEDENNLPIGLETSWTTGEAGRGDFRIVLKHQPEIKTETSGAADGETDLDITFDISIE